MQESTNNTKVKEYHKQFYRPENLFVIITGNVNHVDVFKALKPVEDKIISRVCKLVHSEIQNLKILITKQMYFLGKQRSF